MEMNIDTGAGGWARIELLEETGKPIPGFTMDTADELNINSTRAVASWEGKSDLSTLSGKAIRMRVKMRAAKLYAFQFR